MTADERSVIRVHISILREKIIKAPITDLCSKERIAAVEAAMKAMARYKHIYAPCERMGKVLLYHVNNPTALLFKDKVTMTALQTGVKALEYILDSDGGGKKSG